MIEQDIDHDQVRPVRLPVVQPDPVLRERRPRWLHLLATLLGGAAIVILMLYATTRPADEPQLAANTEATETAPAPQPNAPAPNAAPNPTTTGQGSGQPDSTKNQGPAQNPSDPPAAGGAATGAVGGPGARPAPQPR